MTKTVSTIITNKPRENRFRPLASAQDPRVRPTYAEQFVRDAPPKVISNEVLVPLQSNTFDPLAPADIVQVLQLALPVPMPVGVILGAYLNQDDRFRQPSRMNAENDTPGSVFEAGRYIIEWGLGEARNYIFTDLAPGSIQIPACQFVNVSAHSRGQAIIAGVTAMPGFSIGTPSATYTTIMERVSVDGSFFGMLQPYCREVSAGFSAESAAGDDFPQAQLRVTLLNAFFDLNMYLIPAPIRPNGPTIPQPLEHVAVPGSADRFLLEMEDIFATGGSNCLARASFEQIIHL